MRFTISLILFVCCVAHLPAQAQAQAVVSEKDFLEEMPLILSVSRLSQRLDETPGAVTILDRQMIRLSGARDVADLLRLVPGFQTSTSFESGAPLASYHGAFDAFSNRIQVLIDGRSSYAPFFIASTGPGLQSVALTDIERIEVLRGSNSAAYGARAFLGVINIVTRDPVDTQGLKAALASGENGIRDANASIGWGQEDRAYRLTLDRRADSGLRGANGYNKVERVNFRSDIQGSADDEIELRLGTLAIDSGKGLIADLDSSARGSFLGSNFAQFDWRHKLGETDAIALNISHEDEVYRDSFPASLLSYGINDSIAIDWGGHASNDTISLQHTLSPVENLRLVWGGELRREQVVSPPLYNTDATFVTDFTRLFGNAEWRVDPRVVLNAGAMAEHSSVTGDSVAPRLMLNWHVAEGQTWRAGFSRAFRPPSTFEKFSDQRFFWNGRPLPIISLSSGGVQPESILARELGYLGDFPSLQMSLDVRAFNEKITGFVRRTDARPYDYTNNEDFTIQGLEYQLKWKPWRDTQVLFSQAFTSINSTDPDSHFAAPTSATSLTLFQKLPGGLDLSIIHHDAGSQTLVGGSGQFYSRRTDFRLGWPMRFGQQKAELALVVQNLDQPYTDFDKGFLFERRAFVTLRVEN